MLKFRIINSGFILVITTLLVVHFLVDTIPVWVFVGLGVVWLSITALGSALIGWNYHLNCLNQLKGSREKMVAITFDDGPHPEFTPKVLALLAKHDAYATFFCIGHHIEKYPELFKAIISQGHTIGNHTYSHVNHFGTFGKNKVLAELEKTNRIIRNLIGENPIFFRPAFGVTNPSIKWAVNKLKMQGVGWSKRSLDTTNRSEQVILNRITSGIKPGDVILMHDASEKSIAVLEQLLLFLKKEELKSVTVDHLFKIKPYA